MNVALSLGLHYWVETPVNPSAKAEPVAHADGADGCKDRLRRAEREQPAQERGVGVVQREESLAGRACPRKAGIGAFHLEEVLVFAADHRDGRLAKPMYGFRILCHDMPDRLSLSF